MRSYPESRISDECLLGMRQLVYFLIGIIAYRDEANCSGEFLDWMYDSI